jgi:cobalt/nickel transport system permease protein
MHIPDGYLSPVTASVMYGAAAPFWYVASMRVRQVLTGRTVPVLALFAAFSFVVMMFNIPLPGGTTGHAVGGTLLAITLGPWAAVIGISVVLGIQALFFGDGGLIAFGANCFNMAIVLPLVGYFVYKVISAHSEATSPRRLAAAVVASYVALAVAALLTAIEFGLQPHFFHAADGTPLYCPYGLNEAIPAMMIGHLLVACPIEALATGMVFAFLQRTHSSLIKADVPAKKEGKVWLLWGALGLVALATPIGLLASGTAWGEWGADELKDLGLGFVPGGLDRFAEWWPAPLPDYGIPRVGAVIGYILCAFIGIALVAGLIWLLGRVLLRKGRDLPNDQSPSGGDAPHTRSNDFLSKNLSNITHALESVISAEDLCRAPGLLQGLDARIKVLTVVLFIVVVGLVHSLPVLAGIFVLILALALLSKIPPGLFLRRILIFIPLFTAVIAIPALFITPGDPLATVGSRVIITEQGARSAGLLILRVTDSLSFGILLVLTTRWTGILAALRWFHIPSVFVTVLGMTYRYIFLLLHTANSMFLARRSRSLGTFSARENRRWLGQALGTTIAKSHQLSEEVYLAMLSRGYRDEGLALNDLALRRRDFLWAIIAVAAAAMLLWSNWL